MGSKRRESDHRLRLRASRPPEQRDTLLPCPNCGGGGSRLIQVDASRYRMRICRWCDGTGCVEHAVVQMFRRWTRILAWNRSRGACPE